MGAQVRAQASDHAPPSRTRATHTNNTHASNSVRVILPKGLSQPKGRLDWLSLEKQMSMLAHCPIAFRRLFPYRRLYRERQEAICQSGRRCHRACQSPHNSPRQSQPRPRRELCARGRLHPRVIISHPGRTEGGAQGGGEASGAKTEGPDRGGSRLPTDLKTRR